MNPQLPPPGNPTPPPTGVRRETQIQGPRPSPLKINRESCKIRKPPIAPRPAVQATSPVTENQPIIIYSVSPKPIVVEVSDFRSIVQHLTGRDSIAPESSNSGEVPVSPAARLAALERTSPKERDNRDRRGDDVVEMMGSDGMLEVLDMSQLPGILSPEPANLSPISAGTFSPAEGQVGYGLGMNEWLMSPFMSNTSFLASPSALLLSNAPIVSPSPSSFGELFNNFDF